MRRCRARGIYDRRIKLMVEPMTLIRQLNACPGGPWLSATGLARGALALLLAASPVALAYALPLEPASVGTNVPTPAPAGETTSTPAPSAEQVEELQQQINALSARLQGLSTVPTSASSTVPLGNPPGSDASVGHRAAPAPVVPDTGKSTSVNGGPVSASSPPPASVGHGIAVSRPSPAPVTPVGEAVAAPAQAMPLPQAAQRTEPVLTTAPAPRTADARPADTVSMMPSTDVQRQAYASGIGVWQDISNSLASQRSMGIELDPNYVMAGVRDAYAGRGLKMSASDISDAINDLNRIYSERAADVRTHQETEGKAYRISFSKQKGAFSDAGAWYRVGNKGKGPHLRPSDMAVLQITGTLPDGTVFDASGRDGQEKTVKVGAMLPAVAIGLQKVGVGGELTVVVPPGKGYGDAGMPPAIPGGATLIFDIVVRDVESGRGN